MAWETTLTGFGLKLSLRKKINPPLISTLKSPDNNEATTDNDKAAMLNSFSFLVFSLMKI